MLRILRIFSAVVFAALLFSPAVSNELPPCPDGTRPKMIELKGINASSASPETRKKRCEDSENVKKENGVVVSTAATDSSSTLNSLFCAVCPKGNAPQSAKPAAEATAQKSEAEIFDLFIMDSIRVVSINYKDSSFINRSLWSCREHTRTSDYQPRYVCETKIENEKKYECYGWYNNGTAKDVSCSSISFPENVAGKAERSANYEATADAKVNFQRDFDILVEAYKAKVKELKGG